MVDWNLKEGLLCLVRLAFCPCTSLTLGSVSALHRDLCGSDLSLGMAEQAGPLAPASGSGSVFSMSLCLSCEQPSLSVNHSHLTASAFSIRSLGSHYRMHCDPPKFTCWSLNLQCDCVWRQKLWGGSRVKWDHKDETLIWENWCLCKKMRHRALFVCKHKRKVTWGHGEETAIYLQDRKRTQN